METNIKEGIRYTKTHQWIDQNDGTALIGITDYAQRQLKALVFITLPEVGENIEAGEPFAEVESMKVVSDVHSPVKAVVTEINETLLDEPHLINEDPYGSWFVKVSDIADSTELLSAEEYRSYVESLD